MVLVPSRSNKYSKCSVQILLRIVYPSYPIVSSYDLEILLFPFLLCLCPWMTLTLVHGVR